MTSQQQQQQDKLKQLGNTLVQREEYEQASKFYDRALELDSTSEAAAAIFSNRSLCFLNMKKYKDALQDAEKAISLRSTWHRGYQRAAAACEKLDKHEEGLKHLEKSFELDEASKDDCALTKLKETFEINIIKNKAPSMTQDELKQIGNNFAKDQKHEQAITIYTLAIEKDAFCDEAVPILSNRSMAYFKIGKFKEAYEDGGFCCGIKPDWAKGFMRRGVAAEKLNEWQIALESYDEYLQLDPKDEAGVAENRNHVKKMYEEKIKEAKKERKRLEDLDAELTTEKDPCAKAKKSYMEFVKAATEMNTESAKLARKHGLPRLDALVDHMRGAVGDGYYFTLEGLAETKEKFLSGEVRELHITTLLEFILSNFNRRGGIIRAVLNRSRASESLSEKVEIVSGQVSFLEFLMDIAEEEDFNCTTSAHSLVDWMETLCSHTADRPIRKDLIFVLFDRIKIAKQIFLGKTATDGEFGTYVLSKNFSDHREYYQRRDNDPIDMCTQDIYECIQTCLNKAGGAQLSKSNVLTSAVTSLRSVRVVELLIRYGANPNETEKEHKFTVLGYAFRVRRPDIARVLISHGAKLAEAPTPKEYFEMMGENNIHPLVTKIYSPDIYRVFVSPASSSVLAVNSMTDELVQLLFECLTNQNLSFVSFHKHDTFDTKCDSVLTLIISAAEPSAQTAQTMLRLKPELATLLVTSDVRPINDADIFAMPIVFVFSSVAKKRSLDKFSSCHKSIAISLVEAGYNFYKHSAIRQKRKRDTSYEDLKIERFLSDLISIIGNNRYLDKLMEALVENTKKEEPPKKKVVPLPKRGRGGRR